jgi:hypothetical protein
VIVSVPSIILLRHHPKARNLSSYMTMHNTKRTSFCMFRTVPNWPGALHLPIQELHRPASSYRTPVLLKLHTALLSSGHPSLHSCRLWLRSLIRLRPMSTSKLYQGSLCSVCLHPSWMCYLAAHRGYKFGIDQHAWIVFALLKQSEGCPSYPNAICRYSIFSPEVYTE